MNSVNRQCIYWSILTLILVLLVSCVSSGRAPSAFYGRDFSYVSFIKTLDRPTDPRFTDILDVLRKNQAKKIADGLQNLRADLPQYLNGYTLLYYSRSLQDASFLNPRAVIFGQMARTVISFNGSPEQGGYHVLESIEYEGGEYKMREILFVNEDESNPRHMAAEEIDLTLSTPNIEVSKPNIARCTACHGERPRPIWDNYFLWPGVYGSQDDRIYRMTQNVLFLKNEAVEEPQYKNFVQKQLEPKWAWQKPHPRYSKLNEHSTYLGEVRPNAVLTHLFAAQSMHRLARDIKAIKNGKETFIRSAELHNSGPRYQKYHPVAQNENLEYNFDVVNRHLAILGKGIDHHALEFYDDKFGSFNLDPSVEDEAFVEIRKVIPVEENPELLISYIRHLKQQYPSQAPLNIFAGAIRTYRTNSRDRCFVESLKKVGLDFRNYVINRERAPTLTDGTTLCLTLAEYLKYQSDERR